jgi:uncharacterized protein involved in type VI secretion and phage assembly
MVKVNGAQIAKVLNTMDPTRKGRAQVLMPQVAGAVGTWALVCQPFGSGPASGPQVGDDVVAVFENGDSDRPIVLGTVG